MQYSQYLNPQKTPATEPIPGKNMVANDGGGYGFAIDKWKRLDRFLILGSEGGTYYVNQRKLTVDNAHGVIEAIKEDGVKVVNIANTISVAGRAPKNDAAIFTLALAMSHGDADTKKAAYAALPAICRTGTHLFQFCQAIQDMRGWSRGLRKAVANWYLGKDDQHLEYQLAKYQSRDGWTHRDVLRLCHAKVPMTPGFAPYQLLLAEAAGKPKSPPGIAIERYFFGMAKAKHSATHSQWSDVAKTVIAYRLTREMIPTEALNKPEVQEALLHNAPPHAILRNLGGFTASGFLQNNFQPAVKYICDKLRDPESLKKARVHPVAMLNALSVYRQGHGDKGKLSWKPVSAIVDALDEGFYVSFGAIQPSGKNLVLALDVSASMAGARIAGMALTAREASAAMALVTAATERNVEIAGFATQLVQLRITPKMRLAEALKVVSDLPFGATNPAAPIQAAQRARLPADAFIVYTDNEANTGTQHASQALKSFNQALGRQAKLVVVGMTASGTSIAEQDSPDMMDVVGFDTAAPQVIADFVGH